MCKSEIFARITALVSKGTEIPAELIVSVVTLQLLLTNV